jgi:glutaconate CoA-transferase subunit B
MRAIDQIIVSLSRTLKNNSTIATGVASPLQMIAILLAQKTKKIKYLNCIGAVNPQLKKIPMSSVSVSVLENKEKFIELGELWEYALAGKIDTMFFSAAQIDKHGNLNMTCIGNYKKPKVKLPGPAGSITLRNLCKNCIVTSLSHSKRVFVENVDFITNGSDKPTTVITNLGILRLGKKQELVSVHPYSDVEEVVSNTGFELHVPKKIQITKKPTEKELELLERVDPSNTRYSLI